MNQGQGGGPPEHAGPPDDNPGRGPPKHAQEKFKRAKRNDDGSITVGDDSLQELEQRIDWDNLSPFEEFVLAILDKHDLLDE